MSEQKRRIRILRRTEVFGPASITGLPFSSGYELIAKGNFPKPVPLNDADNSRAVGWLDFEVDEWIESRIKARDSRLKAGAIEACA